MEYLPGRSVNPESYSIGSLCQFKRCCIAQLDVHVVSNVADRKAAGLVLDLADEVDHCVLRAETLGQRQLAAGDLDHDRHEVLGAVELEIVDLHGDGQVGDGIAQHQCVFELPLLVHLVELGELLVGVVALAIGEAGVGRGIHGDLDAPEAAVLRGVGGVVANDVVVGDGALRLHDASRQVVVVEQRLAARIGSK